MIPYGRQTIDDEDIAAVVAVLKSDWLTQGPVVGEFEARICEIADVGFAVAFANGTAALHAAAHAAELGTGDIVCTSPLTFVATPNSARYVGADVVFADVDPDTWNLDLERVPKNVDALIAVHYAGLPMQLQDLQRRPRIVIEDAAHAIGARTASGPIGNCAHSDMCCFSFHPVKTVTTGEGGVVTTNSAELADRLRRFRHHGIAASPEGGTWSYDVAELGFNYRLTDIQCALGVSQLRKLESFIERRNQIADRYRLLLSDFDVETPPAAPPGSRHAYHLFPVLVDDRRRVVDDLRAAGIAAQVHYIPAYRLSAYSDESCDPSMFPATESVYSRMVSLPMFPALTDAEQDHVVNTLGGLL